MLHQARARSDVNRHGMIIVQQHHGFNDTDNISLCHFIIWLEKFLEDFLDCSSRSEISAKYFRYKYLEYS